MAAVSTGTVRFFIYLNHQDAKDTKKDPLSNRNERFDKPLNPSGNLLKNHRPSIRFPAQLERDLDERWNKANDKQSTTVMCICPQGMMVYLISCPDQVKNKIFASFAPSWFNLIS